MSAHVICISRTAAAGGEAIGQMVAARLGFRYLDDEIISLAAEQAQLDLRRVAEVETPRSFLARLLDAIADRGASLESPTYLTRSADDGSHGAPSGEVS